MNNSIQVSTSASVQPTKKSAVESTDKLENSEDSEDFTTVLASAESTDQQSVEDHTEQQLTENNSLIKENMTDGSSLPAEEAVLWQALMLMQPVENSITNSASQNLQSISLFESKTKPLVNPALYKQDYFNILSSQNKEASSSLPAGFVANNINMLQLAGAQFTPEASESALVNITEQFQPIQGVNTTLSQSLSAIGLGTATQAAATQTQLLPLNLGQNAWETNLGSRLQMMVGQNVQTAEIRLDPPELGTLDIKIKITNDVASVNINSAHAHVREALEMAVPKLREMFAETGISLGDVNVQQESFAQEQNSAEKESGRNEPLAESEFSDDQPTVHREIVSDSLLDIYA